MLVLVGVRQPLAVGRTHAVPAQHLGIAAQLFAATHAVDRIAPELGLAALGRHHQDALAVGRIARIAKPHARLVRHAHQPPRFGRRREHLAARREDHPRPIRRHVPGGQVLRRLPHPALAQLFEVGDQRDRHHRVLARLQIEQRDVRAILVRDAAVGERRTLRVIVFVPRVLLQILALGRHRPDVHYTVAIAQEVHAPLPEHRVLRRARIILGQRHGLRAGRPFPQALHFPALVALGRTALERQPREDHRFAIGQERGLGRLGQLDRRAPALQVQRDELRAGQRRKAPRPVQQPPVRGPARHHRAAAIPRAPRRQTALDRHRVNLIRPFVLRGEGDRPSVRRNRRRLLLAWRRGQAPRRAALGRDAPQIAFRREQDRPAAYRRVAVVARPGLGAGQRAQRAQTRDDHQHAHEICLQRVI